MPQTRKTKFWNVEWPDATKGSLFPSLTRNFQYSEGQLKDIEACSIDVTHSGYEEWGSEAMRALKAKHAELGRILPMSMLQSGPMWSYKDGPAMLLPLDNKVGRSYLSFADPLWEKFLRELYCEFKANHYQDGLEAMRTLVVAYNYHAPYAVELVHSDEFKYASRDEQTEEYFRTKFAVFVDRELEYAINAIEKGDQGYIPNQNPTKSTGFNRLRLDGTPFKKSEFSYVPAELYDDDSNLWAKNDLGPLKDDYIKSGFVTENLKYALANSAALRKDPSLLVEFLERQNCSVHTNAFRTNNADPSICDESVFDRWANGEKVNFYHKNRDWTRFSLDSNGSIQVQSGVFECEKLNDALRQSCGFQFSFDSNKKRKVYPAPTVTFSPPYITLCRAFLHRIEESKIGFPSEQAEVLKGYVEYHDVTRDIPKTVVTFDRKHSEESISANFDHVLSLLPTWLMNIVAFLGIAILPSNIGPRVVSGALPSGTAPTTFLNFLSCLYEWINMVWIILKHDNITWNQIADEVFDQLYSQQPTGYFIIGSWIIKFNIGTDDQAFYLANKAFRNSDELTTYVKTKLDEAHVEKRNVSFDVGFNQTVFGMCFGPDSTVASKVLGLNKLFLIEKAKLGDSIALKMFCRFSLLPDVQQMVQRVFDRLDLGTIATYKKGAESYFKGLAKFGYAGMVNSYNAIVGSEHGQSILSDGVTDIFNEWNPSERLIMSKYLEGKDFEYLMRPKKMPVEACLEWLKLFRDELDKE